MTFLLEIDERWWGEKGVALSRILKELRVLDVLKSGIRGERFCATGV